MKILVSSCLLGLPTRYDGKGQEDKTLVNFLTENNIDFIPLCCEQLGGLPTPRNPMEIEYGHTAKDVLDGNAKVLDKENTNYSKNLINGAKQILNICKKFKIKEAVLQERSPSCGVHKVYTGNFGNTLKEGRGILSQLLVENGIEVYTVEEFIKKHIPK